MEKEGFARRKAMYERPYQDQFLESEYIEKIMHPSWFGLPRGSDKQYRYAGYVHGRTKGDFGMVQADKNPPGWKHIPEGLSYLIKQKQEEEILAF